MKRTDNNSAANNTIQQLNTRSTDRERDLGCVADDENNAPHGDDHLVLDYGADSNGDNDDEINNDVTSPNNSGAEDAASSARVKAVILRVQDRTNAL